MLIGRFNHTIDAKNRIFIPSKFRTDIGERCVLSKDISDKCINIYSLAAWGKFREEIDALPDIKMKRLKQFVYSNSDETELDSQGRIIVNMQIFADMELKKDVVLTGLSTYVQLWTAEEWQKIHENINDANTKEAIIKHLLELGF